MAWAGWMAAADPGAVKKIDPTKKLEIQLAVKEVEVKAAAVRERQAYSALVQNNLAKAQQEEQQARQEMQKMVEGACQKGEKLDMGKWECLAEAAPLAAKPKAENGGKK